ncbi:hypothetical protein BYT27DRAFT_6654689 [Phlegmacium glaucopus]|nr:hypothetical protein BYT27DRAFT_6654689 [Phlegmacium glaucopus]
MWSKQCTILCATSTPRWQGYPSRFNLNLAPIIFFYTLAFDDILSLRMTEPKAYLCWKENFRVMRGSRIIKISNIAIKWNILNIGAQRKSSTILTLLFAKMDDNLVSTACLQYFCWGNSCYRYLHIKSDPGAS